MLSPRVTVITTWMVFLSIGLCARIAPNQIFQLNVRDGLSHNGILSVIQDKEGFIWVGTAHGLNRFDGRNFVHYTARRGEGSISANYIFFVHEDAEGELWIGTSTGGINHFNRETRKFTTYLPQPEASPTSYLENSVWCILEDKDGVFWLGSDGAGLRRFNSKTGEFRTLRHQAENPLSVSDDHIRTIFEDSKRRVWLGSKYGGLSLFDRQSESFTNFLVSEGNSISDNHVRSINETPQGNLLIGTNVGIDLFDPEKRVFEPLIIDPEYPAMKVYTIVEDKSGNFLLGTTYGVYVYDPSTREFSGYSESFSGTAIASESTRVLYEDQTGLLWIGTNQEGLFKFSRDPSVFTNRPFDPSAEFGLKNTIRTFVDEVDGCILMGAVEAGLIRYDPKTGHFAEIFDEILSNVAIGCIRRDSSGRFLVGTWGGGLYGLIPTGVEGEFERQELYVPKEPDLESTKIVKEIITVRDKLWLGTNGGLVILDPASGNFDVYKNNPENAKSLLSNDIKTNTMYEDSRGNIWIGSWDGLCRVDNLSSANGDALEFHSYIHDPLNPHSLSSNSVTSIQEDDEGYLWIATYGGGVNRVDLDEVEDLLPQNVRFEYYGEEDGLSNNGVFSMLKDAEGNFWLSTNYGLSRFDPTNQIFSNFYREDGLNFDVYYWYSAYKSDFGEIYFGAPDGISHFHPDQVKINEEPPRISFTRMETHQAGLKKDWYIGNGDSIEVSHKEEIVRIKFAALDYHDPTKHRYAYRRVDRDENWINLEDGDQGKITFFDPRPGRYKIEAKGTNAFGVWSDEVATLYLTVRPPWWGTWTFRVLAVLLLFGLAYSYYKLRMRHVRKQNRELTDLNVKLHEEIATRKAVEISLLEAKQKAEASNKVKSEFLAQISHEIRTPLNGVLNFSEILRDELREHIDEDLEETFELIKKGGARLTRTIDLILNLSQLSAGAYKPSFTIIDLKEVIKDVTDEMSVIAKGKGLSLEIELVPKDSCIEADYYSVSQLLHNLVENAVKYTEHGRVSVVLRNDGELVYVDVIDTGIGISEEYKDRLFQPFSQENTGNTRSFEGSGLGLSLVKQYCDINNAKLDLETRKGEGSRFTVEFKTQLPSLSEAGN
jgi:signal transduction histidine kinase/ligand-binding sensor domain-containing protein